VAPFDGGTYHCCCGHCDPNLTAGCACGCCCRSGTTATITIEYDEAPKQPPLLDALDPGLDSALAVGPERDQIINDHDWHRWREYARQRRFTRHNRAPPEETIR
jgi:hypothetical protein